MKYDVIVVGAGSAGAILATRLSENPNISVLLLEAGPDYPDIDNLPEEVKYGYKTTTDIWTSPHNWQFTARATDEAVIDIPRGKVTGGSSAINGQIFLRGVPEDFDNWSDWGNDQWGFQKMVPFFNSLETDMNYRENPGDFHGANGPIICHRFPTDEWLPGSKAFVEACMDAGYSYCEDANAPDTTGVGPTPLNNPEGIRWSTSLGYLSMSRPRLNLTIRSGVSVKRVLFSQSPGKPKATGVEVVSRGEIFIACGKEIVLCAGAIASPQLLMLSGIGPRNHLEEHGIGCLIDVPGVGQNLRDHPLIQLRWTTKPTVELNALGPSAQVLLRYTAEGSSIDNDMIVYMSGVTGKRRTEGGHRSAPIGIGMGLGLNLALSKGELKLNSPDYRDQPYLDYNLLDEVEDLRRYRDGIRMLVALERHPSFAVLIENRVDPSNQDLESDDTLDLWIKRYVETGHHVSCTAKMGPDSDPMAVVDQYGLVHGVDRLRVADASIMPDCVRANINVTVMAIGERIADFMTRNLST